LIYGRYIYIGGTMLNNNETSEQRFKRLASHRTNQILEKLRILGNCANRNVYTYTKEDVEQIFTAIEKRVKEIKVLFKLSQKEEFRL